jgi:hypothetical protein
MNLIVKILTRPRGRPDAIHEEVRRRIEANVCFGRFGSIR